MTDDVTYEPVHGSLADDLLTAPPAGYRSREDRAPLGVGRAVFDRAVDEVLRWQIQERVGIRVVEDRTTPTEPVRDGHAGNETRPDVPNPYTDDFGTSGAGTAAGTGAGTAAGTGAGTGAGATIIGRHRRLQTGDGAALHIRAYGVTTTAPIRVVTVVDAPRRGGFAYGTRRGHPESGEVAFLVEHRADDAVELVIRSFSRPATPVWRLLWPFVQLQSRRTTRRYLRVLADGAR